jgi:hypothetical protein
LNTPTERFEYTRLPIDIIPQEIILLYNLLPLVHNGYVYMEIRQGMHGLPQAGILANQPLAKHLAHHGYAPTEHTPGLWKDKTQPILFSLVVDNFGVKYAGKQHADHLFHALEEHYEAATNWDGKLYCGLTLDWNYKTRTVDTPTPTPHIYPNPTPKIALGVTTTSAIALPTIHHHQTAPS